MNTRSKTGIQILQVALGIGLLGDVLLRQMPWGLNVFLFNLAFVAGTIALLWRRKPEYLTTQTWALLGAQVFFAAMFVWRDSDQLHVVDSFAIVATMSVLLVPGMKLPPRVAGIFHYIIGFFWSSLNAAFAAVALIGIDIDWKSSDRGKFTRNAIAIFRGLLLVTPLILIFGALFMAADAAYEGLVERTLNIDFSRFISHAVIFSVFAWATAGYLRGIMLTGGGNPTGREGAATATGGDTSVSESVISATASRVENLETDPVESSTSLPDGATILEHINKSDPPHPSPEAKIETKTETKSASKPFPWRNLDSSLLPSAFTLGSVEVGVVLGLLNLLFLSFVIVQIPYLFGGMDLVQNTPDFKLAEYARRGFGELVAVSALVLPVLMIGHWLVRKDDHFAQKLFRGLASIQIVLLFVIMASAVQRLVILTGPLGYGMTTVRLYPMIFMTWLGVVFVWFVLTVLRDQRKYFAWGALWSAFFILAATHVLNPDAYIVRTNIELMKQGRDFDARYNSRLSSDAIPALLSGLPYMNADQQCVVKANLHYPSHDLGESTDLRSFNWSRRYAERLLQENDTSLHDTDGCSPAPPPIPIEDE
ncbi:MAG TPA: DUF4173 domain-containing protein [Pyrinomonadaceae bacterium]|nr:DUF4173 domain-containing protein [Pyrinomonadaceae bacterium]